MWWPEISSACLISEKKRKTFCAFCCTFVSFIFVVFVIVVFHALFMRIFVFVLPQPYFPPLLFCPDEWCLRFWHCAFSFGWAFILAVWLFKSVPIVFFCTQGRISLRLLHAPGTKSAAGNFDECISGFVLASWLHIWKCYEVCGLLLCPLLNCTISVVIFFVCNLSRCIVV